MSEVKVRRSRTTYPKVCSRCTKPFRAHRKAVYCSLECYWATPQERFWEKVRISVGCWEWGGGRLPAPGLPYGRFTFKGSHEAAHRVSWEIHNGVIPGGL